MRISDWSSDVCSSDLFKHHLRGILAARDPGQRDERAQPKEPRNGAMGAKIVVERFHGYRSPAATRPSFKRAMRPVPPSRSEEHTSELQSLMRISYAVFCLKTTNNN